MDLQSLGQSLLRGTGVAITSAGYIGVLFGAAYILDCRRFATTNEGIQGCYAFGGAMAGVGAGVSGIKASGFEQGFSTFNPSLRAPGASTRRGRKSESGPDEGGRDS
jgi:hypothetical protein